MDNKQERKILLWHLAGGVTLAAAYFLITYLSNRKVFASSVLSLQRTKKILQQIKFQVLVTCNAFSEQLKARPNINRSQQDLQIYNRSELAKFYEIAQDAILTKYIVSREEYAASLEKYKKDRFIVKGKQQIFDMLQTVAKGNPPDFTIPEPAKHLYDQERLFTIFLGMNEQICIKIWQKFGQQKKKNPGFNSKDENHFKKAVRELSIYDVKIHYLEKNGFSSAWGCPNEVLFKILESLKQQNKGFKNRVTSVEKAYEKIIDRIINEPHHLDPERIKFLFDEGVNPKAPEVKPVQSQPINPVRQNPISSVAKKPVAKVDQYNIDELMMQQLLSRSQEQPKEAKTVEIKRQINLEAKVQPVQEVKKLQEKRQFVEEIDRVGQVKAQPVKIQQIQQIEHRLADQPIKVEQQADNAQNELQKTGRVEDEAKAERYVPFELFEAPTEQTKAQQKLVHKEAQQENLAEPKAQ